MATPNEGIALLSMYNDEEDDEDEEPEPLQQQQQQQQHKDDDNDDDDDDDDEYSKTLIHQNSNDISGSIYPHQQDLRSPSPEIKSLRSPTPPPWSKSLQASSTSSPLNLASYVQSSPLPPLPPRRGGGGGGGGLAIVDYAHDEAAMSPEAESEEGEIVRSAGRVVVMEMHTSEGSFEERTPPGSVQLLTPSTHPESTQPSVLPDRLKSETDMAIDSTSVEKEVAEVPVDAVVYEEAQKEDPLKSFLPPPLTTKCSDELQEKINRFLAYKKAGKSFNADLRNRKDYRNPDFLQHAVRYQDIDQIGTCLSKNVFDPHGYDRSDYFDEIEADMKREMERKEQERKKTPKVDFVPGGTQPGTVAPVLKTNAQIPGISTSGLQSVSAIADTTREIKQNKKTKWDKIDGDVKNPLQSSSHDNLSVASVHAAHLSAANAGTGYTAFAQQKRREAEERMSGDRKFDRRS